jgi:hypothetical protein
MRFMMLVKSDDDIESGRVPSPAEFAAMGAYNEELVKAGVLLAGEGLVPSSTGARVIITAEKTTVKDGPFAETKELLAGFWLIDVKSREEAIAWAERAPAPPTGEFVIEVRRVVEAEDFGDAFTPELREAEERLRAQTAQQHG